ncbi:hypothetical protein AKJ09_07614 [Labilithrix luteola]|uniref:Lipoprotein n=1 Tax=Labilithrix luteola TaxID=1391654 RepID=A0A0K1Q539_9BACT|nr:hypothetical protein [Labilithrix luteola]AKV00951.1 hypothetical protein AKJ09_07614 [Labilithrix luteola]
MKSAAFLLGVAAFAFGAFGALIGCARKSEPKPEPVAAESASVTSQDTATQADAESVMHINGQDYKITGKVQGLNRQQRERLKTMPNPGAPAEQ